MISPAPSRARRPSSPRGANLYLLSLLLLGLMGVAAPAQTFQILGATVSNFSSTLIPAGVPGLTIQLVGKLPTAATQSQNPVSACFYTGYGSTAPFPISLPNGTNTAPLTIPASTIQSIPSSVFNDLILGSVYFVASGGTCTGAFDSNLTNSFNIQIAAPVISSYTGPTSIPRTNSATNVASPPTYLTLPAYATLINGQLGASTATTVSFGTYGTVTSDLGSNPLHVPVPAAFSSAPVGTTATLSLCNNFGSSSFCFTPRTPVILTVASLTDSTGTLTATPSPVTTADQTSITVQFGTAGTTTNSPGAPSGLVTFTAGGTSLPPASLVLDQTATFTTKTSTLTIPATSPTPTITPASGSYLNSVTVTLADADPNAGIYYTQDGSTPSTTSNYYSGPFQIALSQTIRAIAYSSSPAVPSAVASATYTITPSPPTKLAFSVPPMNTAVNTAISPAVQVAVQDVNGNTVNNSTVPVTLTLANNSANATLGGTLTVNAVNGIATFSNVTVDTISMGYVLVATSGSLARSTSSAFNITPYPITMTVQSALIGINSTLNGTVTLGHAAPANGLVVTLASSTPANVTISPATLNIAAGATTGSFTYTGVMSGSSTLSAAAANYQTGTVQVTGTAAQVSLSTIPPVAPGQSVSVALSLPTAAPAGGTTVTFTSSDTTIATVTSSIFVPAGQRTAATNPQVTGVKIGTANILAAAPGFAPANLPATVTVTATINPSTTYLNLSTSTNTSLNISAPAQAGGLTFTLSSDNPSVATVPASVTIPAGSTKVNLPITGVTSGSTTIRADSTGVSEATGAVTIQSNISVNPATTGVLMVAPDYISLPVAPTSPVTVTVTSSNPAIATLSTSPTAVGTASVTFTNITSTNVGSIYLQGQSRGAVTITVSAPGYTSGTATGTVLSSGYNFYYYQGDFSTTTFSSPTSTTIYTAIYDANNNLYNIGLQLNPGISNVNVPVSSSNTSVGTIATSPVVFHAGDTSQSFNFQPAGTGTSDITIGTPPAPFVANSNYSKRTATVTTPAIQANSTITGVNLINSLGVYLPVAPPNPVTVTVTTNGPTTATISSGQTVVGTNTVTFTNVTSTYVGAIYVQGIGAGNTTFTTSAPGYTSGSTAVTVYPSGFIINPYSGDFSSNTTDPAQNIYTYTALLDPSTHNVVTYGYAISPGVGPATLRFTSSATGVGTLSPTSLVFSPGDAAHYSTFQPVAAGTSTLSLSTPTGYTAPSSNQSIVATVTNPNRSITVNGPVTTGVNLESSVAIYLSTASSTPLAVTVSSGTPSRATLSTSPTTIGTGSVTLTAAANSTYVGTVYVQGLSQGSANLTATATGYTSGTSSVTVDPSGFTYSYYGPGNFSTTTFSQPTNITYYTSILDPSSLGLVGYGLALNPGAAPVSLPVSSSATQVGTVSPTALVFNPGDSAKATNFQPVSAGSTTVAVGTPAGYSTPSNYTSTAVTVTAPAISASNVETGVGLGTTLYVSLPQNPPNPVTITVTTNGPGIATIAKNSTDIGTTTLTFTNVTSTNGFNIYVQGQSLGATTITISAPGYTNGTSNVTVDPAGFSFYYYNSFSTSTTSAPNNVGVYPCSLTPGTLTLISCGLYVNPGLGTVAVPITNSNPAVGTASSPVSFAPGDTIDYTKFTPLQSGTAVLTLGTPAGFSTPSQYTQSTGTVQ